MNINYFAAMLAFRFLMLVLSVVGTVSINHWVLKDNGKIIQKIDSPFHLREPHNLMAFLDQVKYNDFVESTYIELLRQRALMSEQIKFSLQFGRDLVDQAICVVDYYMMEKKITYMKMSKKYLKRLEITANTESQELSTSDEPVCGKFAQSEIGSGSFDNLDSFRSNMLDVQIESEEDLGVGSFGFTAHVLKRLAMEGLSLHPTSWKFHTMSSYYWRVRGNGKQALECARIGIMLAPQALKDIPMLSLGTILVRAGRLQDARVILSSAVEHAPEVPENHFALAATLAMTHDFNRSMHHFDIAERLDPSVLPKTLPVKNFITCLDNLTKKTAKMYSYVEYMKSELKELKRLKYLITQSHEKLIQQQVPLGARFYESKASNDDILRRGQYCATRTLGGAEEPVLFCDFYSDIQMRLESKDVDIEALERDLKMSSEAVIKQVSTKFRKQLNFDLIKATKASIPMADSAGVKENKGKDI